MARSNSGGTRGFLRGKVANDLYQVTKNKKGRKIQLVSEYAFTRQNPNTQEQAIARMQMAACMGSLKQFKAIVDHSFEGIPYGQLSIAHFVQLNIPLLQADCKANWDGSSHFDYPEKGVPAIRMGEWILAEGKLQLPSAITQETSTSSDDARVLVIKTGKRNATFGDLRAALGASAGDYITHVVFAADWGIANRKFAYQRYYLAVGVDDGLVITTANVGQCFTYDGNCTFTTDYNRATGEIRFTIKVYNGKYTMHQNLSCIILSKWNGQVWQRNNAQFMPDPEDEDPYADYNNPAAVFDTWYPDWDGENPY